jgi:hypothetical protein
MGGTMEESTFLSSHLRLNFSTETGGLISATLDQERHGAGLSVPKRLLYGRWIVVNYPPSTA